MSGLLRTWLRRAPQLQLVVIGRERTGSVDEQVMTQVNLKFSVGKECYHDYDGMLFLHAVLKVTNPYVMQIQLNACSDLPQTKKQPDEQWLTFLTRENTLIVKAHLGGTMEGVRLAIMSFFKVLVNIQDINGIRQKIRDKNTTFVNGEDITPWNLVAEVRETIAADIDFWKSEGIVGTPSSEAPTLSFWQTKSPFALRFRHLPTLNKTVAFTDLHQHDLSTTPNQTTSNAPCKPQTATGPFSTKVLLSGAAPTANAWMAS